MFAMTFGHQDMPHLAEKLSMKCQRLNYKQYRQSIRRSGYMALKSLTLDKTIRVVASPLAKYITFAANDCWYSGTAKELIVVYVHSSFLDAHSATSKGDNPSWCESIREKFVDEYWNAIKLEIATLKNIDAWTVIDQGNHNVFASTWASFKCKRNPDELYRSSRHVSVHKVINNSQKSFSLWFKHMLSSGLRSDYCLSWRLCLNWRASKVM